MNRYFTIMVIPEREKGVKSFRIPRLMFHGISFLFVVGIFALIILGYDYSKILKQVYQNKHLTIENRQLKEQIQLFQMKLNSLTDDLERIYTFEKKLRMITGMENVDLTKNIYAPETIDHNHSDAPDAKPNSNKKAPDQTKVDQNEIKFEDFKDFQANEEYLQLKTLYEQKMATNFGLQSGYSYTKEWNNLIKQSFALSTEFATFDYLYNKSKKITKDLEIDVHQLDQFLLDKTSFLRSTPTLMPTKGWITSYYGPRLNPVSRRLRMHEGLDIGARPGTPIMAPSDGIVTFSGVKAGFGKVVQLNHGYGIETIYAHAKSLSVKKGQQIERGELIAKVGSTGASTGPHLHYEIRVNGTPVDPFYYILD